MDLVAEGRLSPGQAAEEAHALRNQIMEASRIRSSDLGKAVAEQMKATGRSLAELREAYARKLFNQAFEELTPARQNKVYLELVESAGRSRPSANIKAARFTRLGKGLLVLTMALAVYNVASAEDKMEAAGREGAGLAGGVLGGAAGGAVAGLACGPGAPVCVGVGAFVGGVLGALGMDLTYDWVWGN
jgi:hypothetical protein